MNHPTHQETTNPHLPLSQRSLWTMDPSCQSDDWSLLDRWDPHSCHRSTPLPFLFCSSQAGLTLYECCCGQPGASEMPSYHCLWPMDCFWSIDKTRTSSLLFTINCVTMLLVWRILSFCVKICWNLSSFTSKKSLFHSCLFKNNKCLLWLRIKLINNLLSALIIISAHLVESSGDQSTC